MGKKNGCYSSLGLGGLLLLVALPLPAAGPFQYHTVSPCRLVDTRNPAGPPNSGPILLDDQTRCFAAQGLCGIPIGARAIAVNITAIGPTGPGFVTAHPCGIVRPLVSSLNFTAGDPARGNGAIVPLCDQPLDFCVFARVAAPGGTMHLAVDVFGYFQ